MRLKRQSGIFEGKMSGEDKKIRIHLNKKTYLIAVGTVLGVILIAWVLLISGIFKKNKKNRKEPETPDKGNAEIGEYNIGEVPEGYQLVFRRIASYTVTEDGKRIPYWTCEYDENGNAMKSVHYDEEENITATVFYTYDSLNRKITAKSFDEKQRVISSEYWEYDGINRETVYEYTHMSYEGSEYKKTIVRKQSYDASGELSIKEEDNSTTYKNGTTERSVSKEEYFRDGNGKRVKTSGTTEYNGRIMDFEKEEAWDAEGRRTIDGISQGTNGVFTSIIYFYYDYDKNGNLLSERVRSSEKERITKEYVYSEQGVLRKGILYSFDGTAYQTSYYDEAGRLLKTVGEDGKTVTAEGSLSGDGRLYECYEEVAGDDGQTQRILTERAEYNEDGKIKNREKFLTDSDGTGYSAREEYDSDGNVTAKETLRYLENGKPFRSERTEYGHGVNQKNAVRYTTFYEDGTVKLDVIYEYDENGNSVKTVQYKDGEFSSWHETEYYKMPDGKYREKKAVYKNEDGSVWKYTERTYKQMEDEFYESRITYLPDGTVVPDSGSYSYESDQYGNPIRYIKYPEGKPVVTEEYLYKSFILPIDGKNGK